MDIVYVLLLLGAVIFAALVALSSPERRYSWVGASLFCYFLYTLLTVGMAIRGHK